MNWPRVMAYIAVILLLAACGLASEPPIVSTRALPTVTPTAPPDTGRPAERVNIAQGGEFFQSERGCWQCHGRAGLGDGPVAANITCAIPALADFDANRGKALRAWFAITTNGNGNSSDCPMPPWKNVLNEQQRWNVVSYAYSLRYTSAEIARGKEIWEAECASCHGAGAAGDGPQATGLPRPVPNISDPAYLLDKSDALLWTSITNGIEGLEGHSFADRLSDTDRYAAIAFLRTLTWDGAELLIARAAPVSTEEATAAPTAAPTPVPTQVAVVPPGTPLTIRGAVRSATAGETVPAGLTVKLNIVEQTLSGPRALPGLETAIAADGTFTFANVERREGAIYVPEVAFGGLPQFGEPVQILRETPATLDMPITVYGVTDDPSVVRVDPLVLIFDVPGNDGTFVEQLMGFRNTSDRIYASGNRHQGLVVDLPRDARNIRLNADLAQQYTIETPAGANPLVRGTLPFVPGRTAVLQVSYMLPGTGEVQFSAPTRYLVQTFRVNSPHGRLRILGAGFVRGEPLLVEGGAYDTFHFQGTVAPGNLINVRAVLVDGGSAGGISTTALALFVSVLLLGGMVFAIIRLNRRDAPAPVVSASDALIRQIAALDERFEKGELSPEAYHAQRDRLKAQLRELLR